MSRIVGSVGLKVQPDTSKFKKEADAELREVNLDPIKVDLEPDADDLLRKAKRAANQTNRRLKSDGDVVKFQAELGDNNNLERNARGVIRRLNAALRRSGAAVKLPLEIDTTKVVDQVEKGIDRALSKIRDKGALQVDVLLRIDAGDAGDDIDDFVRRNNGRNIDLDIGLDRNSRVHAQLAALSRRREVEIVPRLKKAAYASVLASLKALSGLNVVEDFTTNLRNLAQNADRFAISAAKMGVIVGGLSALGLSSLGGLSVLIGNLAQLGGAALALPAAGVALASFIAIGVAGFKNFKDAVGGSAEALAQLPENAQAAALALRGTWSEIQRPVQSSFWMGVGRSVEQTIEPIIGSLSRGLSKVAKPLGEGFGNALSGISDIARSGVMETMFANLAEGVQRANRGIAPMLRGIATIGDRASQKLPKVGDYLARIGENFERWINAAADTGRLDSWLSNAFKRFGQIGDVLSDVYNGFSAINDAARSVGFGGMDTLVQKAQGFRDLMEDFRTQTALRELFAGAKVAMDRFKEGLRPLGTAIADFAPTLADLMRTSGTVLGTLSKAVADVLDNPKFRSGVTSFFDNISAGLQILARSAPSLGSLFGSLLQSAGELFRVLSPVFARVLEIVATAFERVAPAVTKLSTALSSGLLAGLNTFSILITPLATALDVFATVINALPKGVLLFAAAMLVLKRAMGGAALFAGIGAGLRNFGTSLSYLPNVMAGVGKRVGQAFNTATFAAVGRLPVMLQVPALRAAAAFKTAFAGVGAFINRTLGGALSGLGSKIGGAGKFASGLVGGLAGLGLTAALTAWGEMSAASAAVASNSASALKSAQDLAKLRIENPLGAGASQQELDAAGAATDQLLADLSRVAEVTDSGVLNGLKGNRQGLLELYLGKDTSQAREALGILKSAEAIADNAGSGIGDFTKELFTFGNANTDLHKIAEGRVRDFTSQAGRIKQAQEDLLSTDSGKVENNLGVLSSAVEKFGEVTPGNLEMAGAAIVDFTGKPLKGIDAFAQTLGSKLGGSKEEIERFAAGFRRGIDQLGASPQALVQIGTGLGLTRSQIEEVLGAIGRDSEEIADDVRFSFGAVTDSMGKVVTVAGQAVPKLASGSDGLRELGDALASVTDVDSATLTSVFENLGTSANGVATGLTAAGLSAEQISAVLQQMGVPADAAATAIDRAAAAQQRFAKSMPNVWTSAEATNYGKAIAEIGKSSDTAAQKVEAFRLALDQLNGGQLSQEQAVADLNSVVLSASEAIPKMTGLKDVVNATTGQISTLSQTGQDFFTIVNDLGVKSMTAAQTAFDNVFKRTGDYNAAAAAAQKATQGQAQAFVKMATDAGLSSEQIKAVLDRYNLFPDKVSTDLVANASAADSEMGRVLGLLNNYEDPRNVPLGALDDSAVAVLESMGIRLTEYKDGTYSASLGADDGAARSKVNDLASWIGGQRFSGTVTFDQYKNGLGTIEIPAIAKVNTVTGVKAMADGGVLRGLGLVQQFAKGGFSERHVAQIARSSNVAPIRIWAEPETGGEAYIPLAASKRPRSEQILNQVATLFGKRLVDINAQARRYADGGAPTQATSASSGTGVNLTINYPVAEKSSITIDRAQQLVSMIGSE